MITLRLDPNLEQKISNTARGLGFQNQNWSEKAWLNIQENLANKMPGKLGMTCLANTQAVQRTYLLTEKIF